MTQPSDADATGHADAPERDDQTQVDEAARARAHEEWAAADALLEGQPTALGE